MKDFKIGEIVLVKPKELEWWEVKVAVVVGNKNSDMNYPITNSEAFDGVAECPSSHLYSLNQLEEVKIRMKDQCRDKIAQFHSDLSSQKYDLGSIKDTIKEIGESIVKNYLNEEVVMEYINEMDFYRERMEIILDRISLTNRQMKSQSAEIEQSYKYRIQNLEEAIEKLKAKLGYDSWE